MLNGKDYLYLQMIEDRKRQAERVDRMGSSALSQNAENSPRGHLASGDALNHELQQFESHKK